MFYIDVAEGLLELLFDVLYVECLWLVNSCGDASFEANVFVHDVAGCLIVLENEEECDDSYDDGYPEEDGMVFEVELFVALDKSHGFFGLEAV